MRLKIHLEAAGAPGDGFVWWAESDDLPGFSAAADHLPELLVESTAAIKEIEGDDVEIIQEVVFDEEPRPQDPVWTTAPEAPIRQKTVVSASVLEPA